MTATAVAPRYIYDFDDDAPGGRTQLGGKGLGLAEMTHMGLPVPRGFTVTSDACRAFMDQGGVVFAVPSSGGEARGGSGLAGRVGNPL
jgi:phosphoenolpyruvate synthase/pyruvate phosphate dikinase